MSDHPTIAVIEQADGIVSIGHRIAEWFGGQNPSADTYRRGAYFEWLDEQHACGLGPGAPLADIAAEVVRIHAEEQKLKQPDDGLPPGPWGVIESRGDVTLHCAEGLKWANVYSIPMGNYLARCGSPAMRSLLAAFEVTDGPTGPKSRTLVITADGNTNTGFGHVESHDAICWLTPSGKA